MIKLGEKEDCLMFAESFKKKYLCQLMVDNRLLSSRMTGLLSNHMAEYDMWTFDKIKRVITQQNSMTVFYSLLTHQLIMWVLKPGEGLVYFHVKKLPTNDITMIKHVEHLLESIISSVNMKDVAYRCENRALSTRDHDLNMLREKNKQLGKIYIQKENAELLSEGKENNNERENNKKKSPQNQLYDLLIGPMENILSGLEEGNHLVFIPDSLLYMCPFSSLVDYGGTCLGDRFGVSVVSSVFTLDRCHVNEAENMKVSKNKNSCTKRIQPARGWCATVKRDCANCIHLILPLRRPGPPVFLGSQACDPAAWLAERQLLAGDIESNPGPKPTLKKTFYTHSLNTLIHQSSKLKYIVMSSTYIKYEHLVLVFKNNSPNIEPCGILIFISIKFDLVFFYFTSWIRFNK